MLSGIPHGFSTAVGLEANQVLEDAPLVRLKQVHSSIVHCLSEPWAEPREGDALVTDRRDMVLGIVTADCAPVLFADPEAGVIGAAHAGWRGAVGGVLENTVREMVSLGASAKRIRAAIGPTIAQKSYEVDLDFRAEFGDDDARFFVPGREGHFQFDLPAYVTHRLRLAGLEHVEDLREDTYSQPDRFHSYRRATHLGADTTGRQLSMIALRA